MDEEESEDQMELEVSEDNPPDTGEAESTADEDAEAKEDAALAGEKEEEMNESFASMLARLDRLSESKDKDDEDDEDEDEDEDEDSHKLLGAAGKAKKSFGKEQVDELSKEKLGKYIRKNRSSVHDIHKKQMGVLTGDEEADGYTSDDYYRVKDSPEWKDLERQEMKRDAGRKMASAKIRAPRVPATEEQLDELSPQTLKNYTRKAYDDKEMHDKVTSGNIDMNKGDGGWVGGQLQTKYPESPMQTYHTRELSKRTRGLSAAARAMNNKVLGHKSKSLATRVHANEGGYSGADAFKDKLSKSNDPFGMIYGAISGDFGDEIRKEMQAMYDDVVSDSRYHPDDDFEQIIEVMVDQLVNESYDEGKEKVDEWANNAGPGKTVSDTTFERDIDFMTRVISGGLNKPKSTGQTTVPVIAGQDDRMHDNPKDWATLAGIKK